MTPLLQLENLHVTYVLPGGRECSALGGVTFHLQPGESLGVLGESGSGKSTLAAALLNLLPGTARIPQGELYFEGQDVLRAGSVEMQRIRGGRVGFIFQEPSLALHPALRIGEQVGDVIAAHQCLKGATLREKVLQTLQQVFVSDAGRIAESYPHQLSGGQRARVLIAQAIAGEPVLLIADEPTASLDPSTQEEMLALVGALRERLQMALIFITHNPSLLSGLADRVLVLYAGRVVELGSAKQVLTFPRHPYTAALLRCVPQPLGDRPAPHKQKLPVIEGEPPNAAVAGDGCRFEPRCSYRMDVCCTKEPSQSLVEQNHTVSCFKYGS
jgi:oligopeptide/dipeptide ABC transporter ATP-binding protein